MPANSKVVIHWSKEFKKKTNAGMAYVCLGRTEQLKDIYIRGKVDPAGIHASPEALEESKRLQTIFDQRVQIMNEKRERYWKISYLNVASLRSKTNDVQKDNFLANSDIFGLGETWLEQGETVIFNGFDGQFANYGQGKGVSTFSSMDYILKHSVSSNFFSAIHLRTEKFDVIFVYISSNCDKQEIFGLMADWIENERPTTIIGDVNMDFRKDCKIAKFLEEKGFQQLIKKATCVTGSLIDQVYANQALMSCNVETEQCSVYYSDHDIITIYIPK